MCRVIAGRRPGLQAGLLGHRAADVDQVVGDRAKADPAPLQADVRQFATKNEDRITVLAGDVSNLSG